MQIIRPPNLTSLADIRQLVLLINDIMLGGVGFGAPDDGSGDAAGDNMLGTWATASFTALDTATTVTHNLGISTNAGATPNVRWLVFRVEHDGTGVVDGTPSISLQYETGDTVGTNDIELRAYCGGTRTVGASNPITADLFFIPAVI